MLGSLPACAQGSSVLGPCSGDSPVPELVYLVLLVFLFCGLLIGFARSAFRRTGCGSQAHLFWQFCPLGMNCWFWRAWQLWQESWVCKGWTGWVNYPSGFFGSGDWLPCVLAWWGLLSLSGYGACWVIKLTRAPGGKYGLKNCKTSHSPLSFFLVSSHSNNHNNHNYNNTQQHKTTPHNNTEQRTTIIQSGEAPFELMQATTYF